MYRWRNTCSRKHWLLTLTLSSALQFQQIPEYNRASVKDLKEVDAAIEVMQLKLLVCLTLGSVIIDL